MRCPKCHQPIPVYKNPVPTVDIIIEIAGGIVLIERKNPPHGWALPGGFVDYGESFERAAVREALEETGLEVTLARQFHTYSDPDRDPRQHTASTVFIARASGSPRGSDDAAQARIFTRDALPDLVFDHRKILDDYFQEKGKNRRESTKDNPEPGG
jgi:8-oxo-dGTP diphosphatase